MAHTYEDATSVLIIGGGLVGLSAGLFLQHHGVTFILLEQQAQATPLPRSRGIHVRTMELFRQIGLEDDVKRAAEAAWKIGGFGGARRGPNMLASEPLAHVAVQSLTNSVPSPCAFCACPQTELEPELHRPLSDRGGDIRFGHRLVSFTEDSAGIHAIVENSDGLQYRIHSRYLVAADGARGTVRRQLKIAAEETPAERQYINIFFRANLMDRMQDRTFSQCEIRNDDVRGLLISKDNATEWSFHLEYDPARTDPKALTQADHVNAARAAIGDRSQPVEILATTTWSTVVRITDRYRSGRVFFVGDAAHVMPPWGGFNGNTGIADAHNLAWKLAAVLHGYAADALLDTYEQERRPVAVRNGKQARLRTDFDARFDIETEGNHEAFRELLDIGALLMRNRYASSASARSDEAGNPVPELTAQEGTRFPHAWIEHDGERKSTLDLFGASYALLLGSAGQENGAARGIIGSAPVMMYRDGKDFRFADGLSWTQLTGRSYAGSVLVRPDGYVAY